MKLKSVIAAAAAGALLALSPQPASASVAINARSCAEPNGRVNAIAMAGTLAYIGGDFTQVKDERGVWRARNRLAVFDTANCALLPWAPTANASVRALHYYGGVLYAGGDFTTMNGVARGRLASFTTSTGALRPFNPNPNRVVRAFAVAAGRLYIGGDFGAVGTTGRSGLAAFYLSNGALDAAWKPCPWAGCTRWPTTRRACTWAGCSPPLPGAPTPPGSGPSGSPAGFSTVPSCRVRAGRCTP